MRAPLCVLVGVGPGLGLSLARRFGREGMRVAMLGRRAATLESYPALLDDEGIEAHAYAADTALPSSLKEAFDGIRRQLGTPDVLIYNPARQRQASPTSLTPDQLLEDLRVNVVGALASVQEVAPDMRARGAGTILITGDGSALAPRPQWASVGIGKAAARNLALGLAEELEPDGVHVATVTIREPADTESPLEPDRIADAYWQLHQQPPESWDRELQCG